MLANELCCKVCANFFLLSDSKREEIEEIESYMRALANKGFAWCRIERRYDNHDVVLNYFLAQNISVVRGADYTEFWWGMGAD